MMLNNYNLGDWIFNYHHIIYEHKMIADIQGCGHEICYIQGRPNIFYERWQYDENLIFNL